MRIKHFQEVDNDYKNIFMDKLRTLTVTKFTDCELLVSL